MQNSLPKIDNEAPALAERQDGSTCVVCNGGGARNAGCLFNFDLPLVHRALKGDKEAFASLCTELCRQLDRVESKIVQMCPGWTTEHLERVRDLFVHDRFLRFFTNPPSVEIKDFNALCWKFLYDSIVDTWRYYRSPKRNYEKEISADATIEGSRDAFWEIHAAEIVASPARLASADVELDDLMSLVNNLLRQFTIEKQRVLRMWMLGYSEKEIAATTGMTTGNVGSVVSRVISDLRKKLRKKNV